jgi:hypothetical protein
MTHITHIDRAAASGALAIVVLAAVLLLAAPPAHTESPSQPTKAHVDCLQEREPQAPADQPVDAKENSAATGWRLTINVLLVVAWSRP